MAHISANNIKRIDFIQKGNAFDSICTSGIIVESYRILERFIETGLEFGLVSAHHLDFDWLILDMPPKRIAIAVSQGAPMAVDLAERFLASGAKEIIRIGTTGGICRNLKIGDIVLPIAAIREEGTSKFYIGKTSPAIASLELFNRIQSAVVSKNIILNIGIVATVDGRWKETDELIARFDNDRAIAADMESSALFAFGLNKRIPVASISVVTDYMYHVDDNSASIREINDSWNLVALPRIVECFKIVINLIK